MYLCLVSVNDQDVYMTFEKFITVESVFDDTCRFLKIQKTESFNCRILSTVDPKLHTIARIYMFFNLLG